MNQKKLLSQISHCCELAFKRGYSTGYHVGKNTDIEIDSVQTWLSDRRNRSIAPPGTYWAGVVLAPYFSIRAKNIHTELIKLINKNG